MKLLLATPVRAAELATAQVSLGYADFRVQLAKLVPDMDGVVTFALDVVRARNRITGMILTREEFRDVSHVLWCDDDQWPDDPRIVLDMVGACRGVLAAPYTNKRQPLRWVHQHAPGGLLVGFGFTMTTRACLRAAANRAKWYVDLPNPVEVPNVFGQLYAEASGVETLLSEDYSFCVRAHETGYPVELYEKAGIVNHAGGHVWNAREMKGGVIG